MRSDKNVDIRFKKVLVMNIETREEPEKHKGSRIYSILNEDVSFHEGMLNA